MKLFTLSSMTFLMASSAFAQEIVPTIVPCGGNFSDFMNNFGEVAISEGLSKDAVKAVIESAKLRDDVLKLDRRQSSFKQTFLEFSGRTVSKDRLAIGAKKLNEYAEIFAKAKSEYGVAPEVIATFWAMETDFGAVQGDIHTISALATLAHDCRRPALFQPQLMASIKLVEKGLFDPETTQGAWAGEIGMVQMLPEDILTLGIDGDEDGTVNLQSSAPDAILSAANLLKSHGWRKDEPWIQEVIVENDEAWNRSGLSQKLSTSEWKALGVSPRQGEFPDFEASLVAPQGRFGPVFLTYPNYDVFLKWNNSFIYTLSAAYMATQFAGADQMNTGKPIDGLSQDDLKSLQSEFTQKGIDVGEADGIIGSKTREAVRNLQIELGQVPDGWPTKAILYK